MVETVAASFAALLKQYRSRAGLTQEELAERAGLSARAVSDLERGLVHRPYPQTVQRLVQALGLENQERSAFEAAARAPFPDAVSFEGPAAVGDTLGAEPTGPLVAREEEWTHLLLLIDAVAQGGGRLILLPGEAGVGKTRLVQEVVREARRRGFLVGTASCSELDRSPAFHLVRDVLSSISAQVPPAQWRDLLTHAPAMGQLVPNGSKAAPMVSDDPHHLARGVASALSSLAADRPVALALDGLQWADEESLVLLQHLARMTRARPIFLLGTYRESAIEGEHLLGRMVRDLMREGLADRMAVRPLTPEGTAALIAACIGDLQGGQEFVEFVHRRSKGVPFYSKRMVLALGGRYRLVRQIGAGGMGRVFEAVDTRTDQAVAAKILLARTEADVHARLRFEQEGAILATVKHPHIVRVYGTFTEEHASCIVMELLEGESLGALAGQPDCLLPLSRVQRLMTQVLDALACAHERGIAHRDIKPDNVMVLPGDQVKVTDFGIARLLRPIDTLTTMTSTGMVMGTPLYMAPEQIRGEKVDGRADLYAVGAVLYQLMTGRPPFVGDDPLSVAIKHLQEAPVAPRKARPQVPKGWEAVILKALAKDPGQRFQSAAAMRDALGALSTEDSTATSRSSVRPQGRRGRARRPVALGFAITVTAIVALLASIFGLSLSQSPGSRSIASLGPPRPWGWTADTRGALAAPSTVALDRSGDVYVANAGSNTVAKLSPSGALLAQWGTPGSGTAHFDTPSSLAVDRQGHVFVVNVGNHHVQELSTTGKVLSVLAPTVRSAIHVGFVAMDPSGAVYLFDPSGGAGIVGYAEDAHGIVHWAAGPSGPGSFAGSGASLLGPGGKFSSIPSGFAVDRDGNAYVADSESGYVSESSEHSGLFRQWTLPALARAAGGPEGLAVDGHGTVYVADGTNSRVLKLSPDGSLSASWGPSVSGRTRFNHPSGVAVDAQGNVYVANRGSNEILKLSSSGRLLAAWGRSKPQPVRLDNPQATAADGQGDLFVVTGAANDHIEELAPSGRLLTSWGPSFGPRGVARALGGLAADRNGNVYAADVRHNQILKLSSQGQLLSEWAVPVAALSGLAVDQAGNIYVGDSSNSRVVKLDPSGKVVARWSTGSITAPQFLAVDSHGNLYVAYAGQNLVERFSSSGQLVQEWGGSGQGQLSDTAGVAVDQQGNVYVTDDAAEQLMEFSSKGELQDVWGTQGTGPGGFVNPSSVAVDGQGNVYVADTGNDRVQKLTASSGA